MVMAEMENNDYYNKSLKALIEYIEQEKKTITEVEWNRYAFKNNYLSSETMGYLSKTKFHKLCKSILKEIKKKITPLKLRNKKIQKKRPPQAKKARPDSPCRPCYERDATPQGRTAAYPIPFVGDLPEGRPYERNPVGIRRIRSGRPARPDSIRTDTQVSDAAPFDRFQPNRPFIRHYRPPIRNRVPNRCLTYLRHMP